MWLSVNECLKVKKKMYGSKQNIKVWAIKSTIRYDLYVSGN